MKEANTFTVKVEPITVQANSIDELADKLRKATKDKEITSFVAGAIDYATT